MANPGLGDDLKREALEAFTKHGTVKAAAAALGLAESTYRNRLNQARMDDGQKVKGTSTLYDEEGKVKLQWVKIDEDRERQQELFEEAIKSMAQKLPRVTVKPPPPSESDLMAVYPVGDHHLGMLAWHEETGGDYDLDIGETLLIGAADYLIKSTPDCSECAVVFLGDFMHYDSWEPVTPTSKNQLDADSRFPKMVRAAIRSMRYLIESSARKHSRVRVIVEIGNHDLASSIFLMECLANIYEGESRITVDTSPMHYHYFSFGKNLVGTHHGHGVKMDKLPLIMATDKPEEWGGAEYRYWYTGHVHHDQRKDYSGCTVESFRVLAPADAYAAQKGYRSQRDMKAIVLHRNFGEVARHTVNPEMLR